ncbi:uncharacterized protein LOC124912990 [Impatiens glandulifera]|uniref:uncharacterized protein LOC124912990 n=1 Tax=Impatiens glandulifera TaxID=253017 RepID=UPI001FB0FBE0|nr:uncharacterized protein LOC124912990 [Impatiens glandulifera]
MASKLLITSLVVFTIVLSIKAAPAPELASVIVPTMPADEPSSALSPESLQQQQHTNGPIGFFPFPGVDIAGCFSAIFKVEGCALQIVQSIFEGHLIGLSPACCDIIDDVKDNCIPKVLPLPDFPIPFLFGNCGKPSLRD